MRENGTNIFHKIIITSICCIILTGCGHKTAPIYVADDVKSVETQK